MVFARQAGDPVVCAGTVGPIVAVHPDAELKLEPARDGLFADEFEHFQVPVALGIRQFGDADVVARNRQQERVREQKVGIGDIT